MAQGLSNGCAGLLAFPCVFLHALTLHNTGTNQKKVKTDNLLGIKLWSSHQNMINHLRHNDKSLFTKKLKCKETPGLQPSQKRRLMERKSECTGSSTYSFTLRSSRFQKTSSASLSSLLYPPDQWIEIPSGLHEIAVVMGHVRYGQGTSPSCTRRGQHGKHQKGTTHGTLAHRNAEGMQTGKSSPIGPISKGP